MLLSIFESMYSCDNFKTIHNIQSAYGTNEQHLPLASKEPHTQSIPHERKYTP
jgi:hypothetical protein